MDGESSQALPTSELRVLPRQFGFGIYLSDSDDSCRSSIERWAADEATDGEATSVDGVAKSTPTVYGSAQEASVSNVATTFRSATSNLDDALSLDFDKGVKALFPNKDTLISLPLPRSSGWLYDAESAAHRNAQVLFRTARLDTVIANAEKRRIKECEKLKRQLIETLAKIDIEAAEQRDSAQTSADSGGVQTRWRETGRVDVPSAPTTKAEVANESPPPSQSNIFINPTEPAPETQPTVIVAEPITTSATTSLQSPESSRMAEHKREEMLPTAGGSSEYVTVSEQLLQTSEQLGVPSSAALQQSLFPLPGLGESSPHREVTVALHAAQKAMDFEAYHHNIAEQLVIQMGDYSTNVANRSICKLIDKRIRLAVAQISASETHIKEITTRILNTAIEANQMESVIYSYAQLSRHIINKCAGIDDSRVFAVAKILVLVTQHFPKLLSLFLSFLHQVSILTVPKYYSAEQPDETLFDKLGFKDIECDTHIRKETLEEFITRQSGYVRLYAAIVELNNHLHGLDFGWSYVARILNNLPPSRTTASALMSFLSVAGYSLYQKYGNQFYKVLLYIHSRFLVDLASSSEKEARSVYVRLQTYIEKNQFLIPPAAKNIPTTAESLRILPRSN